MTTATLRRLSWQIPVLLLLPSVLLPAWSWQSAWFGAWPLWLAAMPTTGYWLTRRATSPVRQLPRPARAQVLVFPTAGRPQAPTRQAAQRAA